MATVSVTKALEAEEQLATDLNEYIGEWVAVCDHDVVCHTETLRGLLDAIETQDIDRIDRIFEVSEDPGIGCFF
ncbi:MAG TPA: hypothetical protein VES97_01130 [Solirubrobacteraceae bacterium]|nr:hypothetical protein [Solirubrobacteraceae bacterium]